MALIYNNNSPNTGALGSASPQSEKLSGGALKILTGESRLPEPKQKADRPKRRAASQKVGTSHMVWRPSSLTHQYAVLGWGCVRAYPKEYLNMLSRMASAYVSPVASSGGAGIATGVTEMASSRVHVGSGRGVAISYHAFAARATRPWGIFIPWG